MPLQRKTQNLKKPRGFKNSSRRWLQRQINDPYVHQAHQAGYRSRAAFKLLDIQKRFSLIQPHHTIIDLGCAPGSWSQIILNILHPQQGTLLGIDCQAMDPLEGMTFIQGDFEDPQIHDSIHRALQGRPVDGVVSDMAPSTVGEKRTDHWRIMNLVETALEFAIPILKPGGYFVSKTRQGGSSADFMDMVKASFHKIHHVKPPSSRRESSEMFVVARDRKDCTREL